MNKSISRSAAVTARSRVRGLLMFEHVPPAAAAYGKKLFFWQSISPQRFLAWQSSIRSSRSTSEKHSAWTKFKNKTFHKKFDMKSKFKVALSCFPRARRCHRQSALKCLRRLSPRVDDLVCLSHLQTPMGMLVQRREKQNLRDADWPGDRDRLLKMGSSAKESFQRKRDKYNLKRKSKSKYLLYSRLLDERKAMVWSRVLQTRRLISIFHLYFLHCLREERANTACGPDDAKVVDNADCETSNNVIDPFRERNVR